MSSPNILFIVLDTTRADIVYSLLKDGKLEGLRRFADDGLLCTNAFSNASWTLPSHASMFTGQRVSAHQTHAGSKSFSPSVPPLAELFSSSGYETRGITGNSWISDEFGFDKGFEYLSTKWDRYWGGGDLSAAAKASGLDQIKELSKLIFNREAPLTLANLVYDQVISSRNDFGAKRTTDRTINWLNSRSHENPFFYFINYIEPHLPYEPPEEYKEQYIDKEISDRVNQNAWEYIAGTLDMSDSDFEILKNLYRAEIAYLDSHLQRLYNTLESTGYLENTAVVIAGDHGENIGEHELMDHQYALHDTLLHVPLIIHYPDKIGSGKHTSLVELRDIYPTLTSIANIDAPSDNTVSSIVINGESDRKEVYSEYRYPQPSMESLRKTVSELKSDYRQYDRSLRAIRTKNWKLIEAEDGETELYKAGEESTDHSNLHPDLISDLRHKMNEADIALARGKKQDVEVTDATKQRLEDLGYV